MSTSTTNNTPSTPSSNSTSTSTSVTDSSPSMLHGHAQYIQGAVSSLIGLESAETIKSEAISEMREAKELSSTNSASATTSEGTKTSNILGEVETVLGKITGCEGMKEEGEERKPASSSSSSATTSTGGGGEGESSRLV